MTNNEVPDQNTGAMENSNATTEEEHDPEEYVTLVDIITISEINMSARR